MPVLLFVDSLGTKQAWQSAGERAAKDVFNRFYRVAIRGAMNAPPGSIIDAMIESDSAGFVCESVSAALHFAVAAATARKFLAVLDDGSGEPRPLDKSLGRWFLRK
jgi:hypothetical protein